jgi:hypothetical protein
MAEINQTEMTRTQRRRLVKEKRQAARKRAKRNKALGRWSIIGLTVGVILVFLYLLFFQKPDLSHKGVLRIAKSEHNFGMVSVGAGIKEVKIPLINIGEGALTITGLDSSCGCTTARVVNHGVEGPRFRMASSGRNPKNWTTVIRSGEQAYLMIFFDPAVHPKMRGPVTRIVTVYSDDPINAEQQVKIKVYQIG